MKNAQTAAAYPANFEVQESYWEGDHTSYMWQKRTAEAGYAIVGETPKFYYIQYGQNAPKRVAKKNVRFPEAVAAAEVAELETVAATHEKAALEASEAEAQIFAIVDQYADENGVLYRSALTVWETATARGMARKGLLVMEEKDGRIYSFSRPEPKAGTDYVAAAAKLQAEEPNVAAIYAAGISPAQRKANHSVGQQIETINGEAALPFILKHGVKEYAVIEGENYAPAYGGETRGVFGYNCQLYRVFRNSVFLLESKTPAAQDFRPVGKLAVVEAPDGYSRAEFEAEVMQGPKAAQPEYYVILNVRPTNSYAGQNAQRFRVLYEAVGGVALKVLNPQTGAPEVATFRNDEVVREGQPGSEAVADVTKAIALYTVRYQMAAGLGTEKAPGVSNALAAMEAELKRLKFRAEYPLNVREGLRHVAAGMAQLARFGSAMGTALTPLVNAAIKLQDAEASAAKFPELATLALPVGTRIVGLPETLYAGCAFVKCGDNEPGEMAQSRVGWEPVGSDFPPLRLTDIEVWGAECWHVKLPAAEAVAA